MLVVGALMGVFYLRTMGPRCGDQRCDKDSYCQVNEMGDTTYVCEELHEDCGFWPTCGCLELPEAFECEGSLWGFLEVTVTPL